MGNSKKKAREIYRLNPQVTKAQLSVALEGEVLDRTIDKYLIEFRKMYGTALISAPDQISIKKLEKELARQLEINPTSTVIKSCIDFLKLKAMTDNVQEEIDMSIFIKKGEEYING